MSTIAPVGVLPTALNGLNRATEKANAAAANIASGRVEAEDIVDLKLATMAFKANAAVVRAADELDKRLLDIVA
jgi:hypothetical protein